MNNTENKTEKLSYKKLKYVIRYPKDYNQNKKYPVILALHGAGCRGNDIDLVAENPFFTETLRHNLDVIFVAPQCYANTWFEIFEQLQEFAEYVTNQNYCDKNRVYMLGASMGGYATWQLAMTKPHLFAAIAPVCSGGMYWNAGQLKNVPVWAFHGKLDPVVFCEESEKMVNAVNACGGNAKLTVYPDKEHNAWTSAYSDPNLFEWLLSNRINSDDETIEDKYKNPELFG